MFDIINRLFYGDVNCNLNITSIRMIKTKDNYAGIISAMTLIDNIISGTLLAKGSYDKQATILKHLIMDDENDKNKFTPFIYSTWDWFVKNQKKIKINLWDLKLRFKDDDKLFDILFMNGYNTQNLENKSGNYSIHKNGENLLNKRVIDMFCNVKLIEFEWVQSKAFDKRYWSFSLFKLLELIKDTKIERIKLYGDCSGYKDSSWLSYLWKKSKKELINKYRNEGFKIKFEDNGIGQHYIHIDKYGKNDDRSVVHVDTEDSNVCDVNDCVVL